MVEQPNRSRPVGFDPQADGVGGGGCLRGTFASPCAANRWW